MQEPTTPWRQCPTRPAGAEVLIEHRIHSVTCQERQRKLYHKCFSCVHRNAAHVPGTGGLPPIERAPKVESEEAAPAKPAAKAAKAAKGAKSKQSSSAAPPATPPNTGARQAG